MTIEKLMQNASLRDLKLMRSVLDAKIRELEAEQANNIELDYTVGSFWVFNTEHAIEEQDRNGQRCEIVKVTPDCPEDAPRDEDDEPIDECVVKFDDGHQYVAYYSEIQKPWPKEES